MVYRDDFLVGFGRGRNHPMNLRQGKTVTQVEGIRVLSL